MIGTHTRTIRRMALTLGVLLALSLTGVARQAQAQAQAAAPTAQERAAIELVRQWFAAWQAGDATKMASLMSDNVEFRGIPNQPLRTGHDAFLMNTGRFIALKPNIHITEAVAVGGETGVAVLTKRIDRITLNGQARTVPLAAFFRVHDGKIEEWLDMPLVPLGPPAGGRGQRPAAAGSEGGGR
jgi:uncharacterized protein (TIGR02246 family)